MNSSPAAPASTPAGTAPAPKEQGPGAAPAELKLIALDRITPSPHQARESFDEAGIKALAESMKQEGLLEPILVRQVNGAYELISGERRLRAAKLLGWETIEAKVIQTSSDADAAAKGLVENLQREDLNPIEEAEGFQTLNLLDPKTWTQERIGQIAGHDKSYVNRSLALLTLPEEIKKKLRARNFSRSHGIELARLPTVELQLEVSRQIPYKLTWEETRTLVDKLLGKEPRPGAQSPEPPAAVDPFGTLWTNLFKEGKFPEGTWEARYQRGGTCILDGVRREKTRVVRRTSHSFMPDPNSRIHLSIY